MKLCLSMIVRQEARIILRCLNSVVTLIDSFIIHDTGSTDSTVYLINDFFKEHNIDGKVEYKEFIDFSTNRNLALCQACSEYPEKPILLIDADMEVICNGDLILQPNVSYYIIQQHNQLKYSNRRIVWSGNSPKYHGRTHECCSIQGMSGYLDSHTILIKDNNDGGSKRDKHERDIRLLSQDLEENSASSRSLFYLAQSYHDLGDDEVALEKYQEYIRSFEHTAWPEEVFYSRYMVGRLLRRLERRNDAVFSLLLAFQYRPHRLEPLQELCEICREDGNYHLAAMFGEAGLRSSQMKNNDILFVKTIDEIDFKSELSISLYYTSTKDRHIGFKYCDEVLRSDKISKARRDCLVENMMEFYIKPLNHIRIRSLETPLKHMTGSWRFMNPSIHKDRVNVRAVNYSMENMYCLLHNNAHSTLEDPIKTRNFQFALDSEHVNEIDVVYESFPSLVCGLEDIRFFGDEGWMICTSMEVTSSNTSDMCLISPSYELYILESPFVGVWEKNWLPMDFKDGHLRIIYGFEPITVFEFAFPPKQREMPILRRRVLSTHFKGFRGSAPPVPCPGSDLMLMCVHEVHIVKSIRHYIHRFLLINPDNLEDVKVSLPFKLQGEPVEYVCGLNISQSELRLTFGIGDRSAWIGYYDLNTIMMALK